MSDRLNYVKFWKGKSVLVTGASGFIGGALVERLVLCGAEVFVTALSVDYKRELYRHRPGEPSLAQQVERVMHCDITDFIELGHVFKVAEPDYVFHLAAVTQVTEAAGWPIHTFDVNVMGTLNVLECARLVAPGARIIIASSDKAYGHPRPEHLPLIEEGPIGITHPYDASKLCGEVVATAYLNQYGMKVNWTRMANIYGPGDTNWKRLIPGMVRWALENKQPVIRSDGEQIRQYLFISDAINALFLLAMDMEDNSVRLGTWNIGPKGPGHSVKEIAALVGYVAWESFQIQMREPMILNMAGDECSNLAIDSARARFFLNWEPSCSLKHGIKITMEWMYEMANQEYLLK